MRVIVLGGSGFIGGRFVQLYGDRFEQVVLATRSTQLQGKVDGNRCYTSVQNILAGGFAAGSIDAVVHSAFDHAYRDNKQLMSLVWQIVRKLSIPRLVYLSSFSVYDPFIEGTLTVNSAYSRLHDPYAVEKRDMERVLQGLAAQNERVSVSILQPTIVYGLGGAWTQHIFSGVMSEVLDIPGRGNGVCNAVHVDDVASAIMSRVVAKPDNKISKYIVNGPAAITWRRFYEGHVQVLGMPSIQERITDTGMRLHPNIALHCLLWLWFYTPAGVIFNRLVRLAKNVRKKSVEQLKTFQQIEDRKQLGLRGRHYPVGITRINQACRFVAEGGDAALFIGTHKAFDEGVEEMRHELKGAKAGQA